MNDTPEKETSKADDELEREIRAGRKFTLGEAIGRMAGSGALKGASAMSRKKQAQTAIEEFLSHQLNDSAGALRVVLKRRIAGSEHLLTHFEQPLVFMAEYLQKVLASDYALKEIVNEADIEWGQIFGERPFFEKEGAAPHPDDPYTHESVRKTLTELVDKLKLATTTQDSTKD